MVPILMYHQIGEPPPKGTPYRSLTVHPASFRRQMRWLHWLGYRGLAMRDLLPYLSGEKHGKVVGITFDDGYRNVLQNALPVLRHYRFTATNYFVVNQLGGGNVWDYAEGVAHSDLMTADEMREWARQGMEVGSHTLDHARLTDLSPDAATHELGGSKAALERLVDEPVTAFCYPYGACNTQVIELARAAGYTNATTTFGGLARTNDDPLALPRVTVARSTHLVRFLQKCLTGLEDRRRLAQT